MYLLSKVKKISKKFCILSQVKSAYIKFYTVAVKISSKFACVLYIFLAN